MNELIFRGAQDIIVKAELEKKLLSAKKLRIKFGIDPTGSRIHIGHAATIRKLQHFQDMGHQIVLIVGSFTAQIGDPSDKDSERQPLDEGQIKEHMKNYKKQLALIFDTSQAEIHYNSAWFDKVSLREWLQVNQQFSVAQMIERDNFEKRFKTGKRIGLQEFQYPMLQGYDSVAVKADVEIGGSDQLFNLLAGRTLQKAYDQEPQNVVAYELLQSDDGRKMSKSWGNCIWVDDEPNDMYGKVMRINDDLIMQYYTLVTEVSDAELEQIKSDFKNQNPRDLKARLAREIVTLYHNPDAAQAAEVEFNKQFREGALPSEIEETRLLKADWNVVELLLQTGLISTKSEARRLIEQGGVKLNQKQVNRDTLTLRDGDILQVGKRRFKKVKVS